MSKNAIFPTYFKDLAAVAHRGDAREESFYPALAKLLDGIAQATGRDARTRHHASQAHRWWKP